MKLLGFGTVRDFQKSAGLVVDGISGPKTRAALHEALGAAKATLGTGKVPTPAKPPKRPAQSAKPTAPPSSAKEAASGLAGGLMAGVLVLYAWANDAAHKALEFYHWLTPWN